MASWVKDLNNYDTFVHTNAKIQTRYLSHAELNIEGTRVGQTGDREAPLQRKTSAIKDLNKEHGVFCHGGEQTGLFLCPFMYNTSLSVSPLGSEAQGPRDQHSLLKICAHLITEERSP